MNADLSDRSSVVLFVAHSVFTRLIQQSTPLRSSIRVNPRFDSVFICGLSSALIVFFFLDVRTAFPTGKSAPHPFGGLIQASVVIRACEISYPLALFAHHGIGSVLIHPLGLNELSSRTFFLRHEYKTPDYSPIRSGPAYKNVNFQCVSGNPPELRTKDGH